MTLTRATKTIIGTAIVILGVWSMYTMNYAAILLFVLVALYTFADADGADDVDDNTSANR